MKAGHQYNINDARYVKTLGPVVSIATDNALAAAEQIVDDTFLYTQGSEVVSDTLEDQSQYSINRLLRNHIRKIEGGHFSGDVVIDGDLTVNGEYKNLPIATTTKFGIVRLASGSDDTDSNDVVPISLLQSMFNALKGRVETLEECCEEMHKEPEVPTTATITKKATPSGRGSFSNPDTEIVALGSSYNLTYLVDAQYRDADKYTVSCTITKDSGLSYEYANGIITISGKVEKDATINVKVSDKSSSDTGGDTAERLKFTLQEFSYHYDENDNRDHGIANVLYKPGGTPGYHGVPYGKDYHWDKWYNVYSDGKHGQNVLLEDGYKFDSTCISVERTGGDHGIPMLIWLDERHPENTYHFCKPYKLLQELNLTNDLTAEEIITVTPKPVSDETNVYNITYMDRPVKNDINWSHAHLFSKNGIMQVEEGDDFVTHLFGTHEDVNNTPFTANDILVYKTKGSDSFDLDEDIENMNLNDILPFKYEQNTYDESGSGYAIITLENVQCDTSIALFDGNYNSLWKVEKHLTGVTVTPQGNNIRSCVCNVDGGEVIYDYIKGNSDGPAYVATVNVLDGYTLNPNNIHVVNEYGDEFFGNDPLFTFENNTITIQPRDFDWYILTIIADQDGQPQVNTHGVNKGELSHASLSNAKPSNWRVNDGGTFKCNIVPDPGYTVLSEKIHVKDATDNDVDFTFENGVITILNITSDITISATGDYVTKQFKVTVAYIEGQVRVQQNGVTTDGTVVENGHYSLSASAENGFEITSITATHNNTNVQPSNNVVDINPVQGDIYITINSRKLQYTITRNYDSTQVTLEETGHTGNTISDGAVYTVEARPNSVYKIDSMTVTQGGKNVTLNNNRAEINGVSGNIVVTVISSSSGSTPTPTPQPSGIEGLANAFIINADPTLQLIYMGTGNLKLESSNYPLVKNPQGTYGITIPNSGYTFTNGKYYHSGKDGWWTKMQIIPQQGYTAWAVTDSIFKIIDEYNDSVIANNTSESAPYIAYSAEGSDTQTYIYFRPATHNPGVERTITVDLSNKGITFRQDSPTSLILHQYPAQEIYALYDEEGNKVATSILEQEKFGEREWGNKVQIEYSDPTLLKKIYKLRIYKATGLSGDYQHKYSVGTDWQLVNRAAYDNSVQIPNNGINIVEEQNAGDEIMVWNYGNNAFEGVGKTYQPGSYTEITLDVNYETTYDPLSQDPTNRIVDRYSALDEYGNGYIEIKKTNNLELYRKYDPNFILYFKHTTNSQQQNTEIWPEVDDEETLP